jgi:hypothetical protein
MLKKDSQVESPQATRNFSVNVDEGAPGCCYGDAFY